MGRKKSEHLSIRVGPDVVEYLDRVRTDEEGEEHVSRSEMVRRIILFHYYLMRAPLARVLKPPTS